MKKVSPRISCAVAQQSPGMAIPGLYSIKLTGPLSEAAAVLERAALYVGSDSGLAHLAGAVGGAVTLFAPADPQRVCPFGQRDLVIKPDDPCAPCFMYPWETPYPKMKCTPPFCIGKITPDQVMEKIHTALRVSYSPMKG